MKEDCILVDVVCKRYGRLISVRFTFYHFQHLLLEPLGLIEKSGYNGARLMILGKIIEQLGWVLAAFKFQFVSTKC